mmetsp:Transcript_498/g.1295  ORF Transcript_498/g.1295 Transcript_498/m.1295 type:complete len:263 (+) Transcript_498:351-1139(+)
MLLDEDLTFEKWMPSASLSNDLRMRREASSADCEPCLPRAPLPPRRCKVGFAPRASQKKDSAASESVRTTTRFLQLGGMICCAFFIPKASALISDPGRGAVLFEKTANKSPPGRSHSCDGISDEPLTSRRTVASPSCFDPPPRPLASLVMTSSCVQFAIMSAASREGTLPHLTCGDIDEDTPSSCPPLPWPSRTLANGATNETVAINNDATGEGRIVTRARCVPPLANLVFLMSPCGLVKRGPFVWRRRLECGVSDRERESG